MWFEHFWTQCRLCKLNIKGAWGFWSHLAETSQEGLIPWMHDCTSEHQQGSAEGLRLSWHHTWAVCHGFHVTVLGETCSGTAGHPWRVVGYRELGPCTPLPSHGECCWGLCKWLAGEPGFEIECLHQLLQPPPSIKLFCSASFFLGDQSSSWKQSQAVCSQGVGWPMCDTTS